MLGGADTTGGHLLGRHERQQSDQDGRDTPCRIEGFRVEVADAQTQPGGRVETSARGVHPDRGRREGVVRWEDQRAPVLAAMIGRVGRAGDDVMPSVVFGVGGG